MSDLLLAIDSKELKKGLRPSKRMPRNSGYLTECSGAVGRDGVLSTLDELTRVASNVYALAFDAQTGSFAVGNTVTGATSGATGAVLAVTQSGGVGTLYFESIIGTFQDDEIIYESALGSELAINGDFTSWTGDDPDSWSKATEDANNYVTENPAGQCQMISDGGSMYIYQSILATDSFYLLTIDIKAVTSGAIYITDGDVGVYVNTINTTGQKSYIIQASHNHIFISRKSGGCDITFDDISLKQITNAALANGAASNTFTFPYPQIFVFTNVIIICSATHIYEWVSGALVHKLTVATGSTWSAIDFFDYIYLSNGTVAVERDALDKTYATTTELPTAMAALNYHGQVILGSPDSGYE